MTEAINAHQWRSGKQVFGYAICYAGEQANLNQQAVARGLWAYRVDDTPDSHLCDWVGQQLIAQQLNVIIRESAPEKVQL